MLSTDLGTHYTVDIFHKLNYNIPDNNAFLNRISRYYLQYFVSTNIKSILVTKFFS